MPSPFHLSLFYDLAQNLVESIIHQVPVNKTNRCTEFQLYWYYDSIHVSDSLSAHHQEFLAVQRLWYILCSCDDRLLPGVGWNCSPILLLVANGSSQLHKMYQSRCMAMNSWWWAERLPETCRVVIPIKFGFSVSVGFIHKESVTMHGHTIVKNQKYILVLRFCKEMF
jgi:hypothetical protein